MSWHRNKIRFFLPLFKRNRKTYSISYLLHVLNERSLALLVDFVDLDSLHSELLLNGEHFNIFGVSLNSDAYDYVLCVVVF